MALKWAPKKRKRQEGKPKSAGEIVEEFKRKYPWVEKKWRYERSPGERAIAKIRAAIYLRRGKRREAGLELVKNIRTFVRAEEAFRLFDQWAITGKNGFLNGLRSEEGSKVEREFERIKREILNPKTEFRAGRSLALSGVLKEAAATLAELAMQEGRSKKERNLILRNAALLDILAEVENVKKIMEKRSPLGRTLT